MAPLIGESFDLGGGPYRVEVDGVTSPREYATVSDALDEVLEVTAKRLAEDPDGAKWRLKIHNKTRPVFESQRG
jgi:hypothetical protein